MFIFLPYFRMFLLYLYFEIICHMSAFPPLYKPMAQVGAAAVRAEGSGGRVGHGPARTEVPETETGGGFGSGSYP